MLNERGKPERLGYLSGGAAVVIGIVIWLATFTGDPVRTWRALLVAFLFVTPLAGGLALWSAVVRVSNGRWAGNLERLSLAANGFALPSVLALVALWFGAATWAPWTPSSALGYMNPPLVFIRDLIALIIFWAAAHWYRRRRFRGGEYKAGSVAILAYAAVFSLLGIDLGMGLDPRWHSSLFGGYFFMSGMYAANAAWALLAAAGFTRDGEKLHDLGKLLFAFCLMTTYLAFSQLLPIWYENLPDETRFLVPRLNFAPWRTISYILLGVIYLGPLALLLTVKAKCTPWSLAAISGLILAGLWVERWWVVEPTFVGRLVFALPEIAASLALLGLLALGMTWTYGRIPEIISTSEPAHGG